MGKLDDCQKAFRRNAYQELEGRLNYEHWVILHLVDASRSFNLAGMLLRGVHVTVLVSVKGNCYGKVDNKQSSGWCHPDQNGVVLAVEDDNTTIDSIARRLREVSSSRRDFLQRIELPTRSRSLNILEAETI